MEDLRLIDADPNGGAVWEMDVTEHWVNMNGIIWTPFLGHLKSDLTSLTHE